MTDKEKFDELHKAIMSSTLELIIPAFGKLKLSEARPLLDRMNECLSETPFMYFIFGDTGITVVVREQMCSLEKALFNVDTFQDDREI